MEHECSAMLFCPPLAPLRLDPERPIYIGRQARCDLPLRHEDISRNHAVLRFEGGHFTIRDLGSTNGTFLNGDQITAATTLSSGDRIVIGPTEITFCSIDPCVECPEEESDSAQTSVAEPGEARGNAFAGDLSQIPTFAVLQVLEMGATTGVLELDTPEARCRIWFSMGAPVHAESEKLCGFDAALAIVNASSGSFRFEPQVVAEDATIQCNVTELLLEGSRFADEANPQTL